MGGGREEEEEEGVPTNILILWVDEMGNVGEHVFQERTTLADGTKSPGDMMPVAKEE